MSTRIWLNATATQSLTKTDKKKWDKDVYTLDGVEVETDDKSGEKYISIYADPNDPAASMPVIARKHVKRVSYTDKYYEGFRTDGIYRHKGATARVETIEQTHTAFGANDVSITERYQTLSISAGSMRTLREIYSKVRTGELKPVADWGTSLPMLELRQKQAEKPAPAKDEVVQTE